MAWLYGVTIAATDVRPMAAFYQRVFNAGLRERQVGAFALFVGDFAGVRLTLCPKALAGIDATQNIHQLTIAVADVEATIALAEQHGGSALGESAVRDPDGNSIELIGTSEA